MNRTKCSVHYKQRFTERVAKKSKRAEILVERAYCNGIELEDIADKRLRFYVEMKQKIHGSVAKIYHGQIYWFQGRIATTVYPVPRDYRPCA